MSNNTDLFHSFKIFFWFSKTFGPISFSIKSRQVIITSLDIILVVIRVFIVIYYIYIYVLQVILAYKNMPWNYYSFMGITYEIFTIFLIITILFALTKFECYRNILVKIDILCQMFEKGGVILNLKKLKTCCVFVIITIQGFILFDLLLMYYMMELNEMFLCLVIFTVLIKCYECCIVILLLIIHFFTKVLNTKLKSYNLNLLEVHWFIFEICEMIKIFFAYFVFRVAEAFFSLSYILTYFVVRYSIKLHVFACILFVVQNMSLLLVVILCVIVKCEVCTFLYFQF